MDRAAFALCACVATLLALLITQVANEDRANAASGFRQVGRTLQSEL